MKSWMIAGLGLVMMGTAGIAVAQQAPTNPPPPPPGGAAAGPMAQPPGGPDGPRGPRGPMAGGPMAEGPEGGWGWRAHHGFGHMPPPPPPSKAAFFRLKKGDASIMVKCAEAEPMKACVDAASALLDKVNTQR